MSRWDAPAPGGNAAPSGPTPNATAAAQAAAIAAKIAASLPAGTHGSALIKKSEDEGFVRDIEINDLRNRYVLTKGPTQKKVRASGTRAERVIRHTLVLGRNSGEILAPSYCSHYVLS
jgi:2-polyprenyl-3-methyl-5-hydroxy-6-metoxy-1,4-benzoquinol methylase